jgi:membrane peptidoglycan carboxypeptidase
MLMDVTTDFGGGYVPTDFNGQERGPLRVRNALQFSLNIPAVKALGIVGESDVFARAQDFGMRFQRRRPTAGLSMALGTLEVHPLDLNQSYATLANGGRNPGVTSILRVTNMAGDEVLPPHTPPKGERAISEQAAYVVTDILAGNTDPAVNPIWAAHRITTPSGQRRPAAFKTGTTNDAKDLNAYGYIAPPSARGRQRGEYALSVGVWAGNSDSSPVTTVANPVFSLDVAAPIWDAFLSEVTRSWEVRSFGRPDGLTTAQVDVFTGYQPSQWSRQQTSELFLRDTSPGRDPYLRGVEVVRGADGGTYLWEDGCEGQPRTRGYLDLEDAEAAFPSWNEAVRGWIKRARRGAGVAASVSSTKRTVTAYFYEPYFQPYGQSWGGPFAPTRSCRLAPSASPSASPSPSASASLSPSPSPEASATPTAEPTPAASATPKPTKKPKPTPSPTPEATAEPSEAPPPQSAAPAGGSATPSQSAAPSG